MTNEIIIAATGFIFGGACIGSLIHIEMSAKLKEVQGQLTWWQTCSKKQRKKIQHLLKQGDSSITN